MKTKFKDLLLYTLATIGVVALFISATQTQVSHTTPESHEWEMHSIADDTESFVFAINKKTGEVRKYDTYHLSPVNLKKQSNPSFSSYRVAVPR